MIPASTLSVGQLCLRGEEEDITYLGYPLLLSPDERRLLAHLCSAVAGRENYAALHTPTDTLRAALADDPAAPPSADHISVLVARINRKARDIGGRRLIIGAHHKGYCLNEIK